MTSPQDKYINFGDKCTSVNFPTFRKGDGPHVSSADYSFEKGKNNASSYGEEELIEMLRSQDYEAVFQALGAIGKRKIKKALPYLKIMALYDDDLLIQEDSLRTIRRIGGKKALDILRSLRSTEHREFIDEILNEPPLLTGRLNFGSNSGKIMQCKICFTLSFIM